MARKRKNRKKVPPIRQKFLNKMQLKLVFLFLTIVLAFVGLVGRITYINASKGDAYTKIVLNQQSYNSRLIPFKRGDIVDRNGTVLATSERVYNVILDAYVMLSDDDPGKDAIAIAQVKDGVSQCFEIEASVIDEVVSKNPTGRYCILKKQVSYEQAQQFLKLQEDKENYGKLSCVWLEEAYVRTYPYGTLASDLIGFTVSGNVGNAGIEASYNSILNGSDGREYGYLDADADLERTVKEAVNGKTVVSTIDVTLQNIVEKHILAFNEEHKNEASEGAGSKNTAVMIVDPNIGEILAQASYPNFDPNNPRDLSGFYTQEQIDGMSDEETIDALNQIWKNFCVTDTFEPGSTAKPFTVATGLEIGALNGSEVYNCTGYKEVGGYKIHCHKRTGHGMQTLSQGISNSCNVVMMEAAEKIGVEEFVKYQNLFGFGLYTGIDLPGEALTAGLLYSEDKMGPTELATNSFGQGFNVTMMQMIAGFSSLINGGNYYEPHVVKQIQDEDGNVVENITPILKTKTISAETGELLKTYMLETMTDGTGKNAQVEGYAIGAKTGTAEKLPRGNGKYLLSYIGYAPADQPEVLIYVVIDEPNVSNQSNSTLVTTLARKIMEEAFPYLNITKVQSGE